MRLEQGLEASQWERHLYLIARTAALRVRFQELRVHGATHQERVDLRLALTQHRLRLEQHRLDLPPKGRD
jgi:hypothetical protein